MNRYLMLTGEAGGLTGKQIGTIVILVLALIVVASVIGVILYIRKKVRRFSSKMFGNSDLLEGLQQAGIRDTERPRSVSAMTGILMPKIKNDFPEMNAPEMIDRAKNVLLSYLRGVTERNTACLQEGNSELRNQLENHISELDSRQLRERFDDPHIHRAEISNYRNEKGRSIITFQAALECIHTIRDLGGKLVKGDDKLKYQTRYNVEMIYIQDRTWAENELDGAVAVSCPKCGAPLAMRGAKKCTYCGAPVIEINMYAWSFSSVEEVRG